MSDLKKIQATLCFPINSTQILLGKKKRKLGAGFWNGFGGRVEEGESVLEATLRETKEESGLSSFPRELEHVAIINFYYFDEIWEVYIYFLHKWIGKPKEDNDEMGEFTWFERDALPFDDMWPDDREWLPLVLSGKKIKGDVYFKKDKKSIKDSKFFEVKEF